MLITGGVLANPPAEARPAAPTTQAKAVDLVHGLAYTTTKTVTTNATGKVVARGSDNSGDCDVNPCKIEITQTGHSTLGFSLWHFTTWLKWNYKLQGPGLLHVINVVDKGVNGDAVDQFWEYDGVVDSTSEYYNACCGESHSGFRHYKKGQFSGPSLIHLGLTRHDRPENLILAKDNLWYWLKG